MRATRAVRARARANEGSRSYGIPCPHKKLCAQQDVCAHEGVLAAFTSTLINVLSCPGAAKVRTLLRMPAQFRASLALVAHAQGTGGAFTCVTRDLHVQGALLHLHQGVPDTVRVGSSGRLQIELAQGAPVEFDVVVRHRHAFALGVRFIAHDARAGELPAEPSALRRAPRDA